MNSGSIIFHYEKLPWFRFYRFNKKAIITKIHGASFMSFDIRIILSILLNGDRSVLRMSNDKYKRMYKIEISSKKKPYKVHIMNFNFVAFRSWKGMV